MASPELFFAADRVAEHDQAVRAGGGDRVRGQRQGLLDPLGVDPLADALFHPHPRAAGAAAEAARLAPVHLGGLDAGDRLQDLPRRGVDLVVPAQEARVVIGQLLLHPPGGRQLPLGHQPGQQLGVVDHLVVPAELRVLVRDGVEAVRAGRHDRPRRRLVQRLDVLGGQHREHELVPDPPRRVAGAGLGRAQHGELHPGGVQQRGDRLGRLLGPVLQRARAAHPEQVLHVRRSILPSATGTSKSSSVIHSARRASPIPHGSPLFSRFFSIPAASTGNADSISTWCRRIPSMWSMCSMSTGHSSTHAPQFVQDHSTSGSITP